MNECKKHGNAMLGVSYREHDCPMCQWEAERAQQQPARTPVKRIAIAVVCVLVLVAVTAYVVLSA